MKEKITKFINVTKRDGIINAIKKAQIYFLGNYINKYNIKKKIYWKNIKKNISIYLDEIIDNNKFDMVLVWRGSFGWSVPLYQRPQQIAKCLAEKKVLIFYEVTRMTDNIDFILMKYPNLYLVNYESKDFENVLFEKLKKINKPKFLQLYSTCWDLKKEIIEKYLKNNFKFLYEYIDDLNPILAGTKEIPENVLNIHNYVTNNQDVLVVTTASRLYDDMVLKRGSNKNIILSSNGVDFDHFQNLKKKKIEKMEEIKKKYKKIVGYYGALASWFDYDLVKKIAKNNIDTAFVLIGIKYDTSYDESKIENISNVIFLGPVDYSDLPNFGSYFDIAWIPFVINDITVATNPIKVFEYMALGKFIITSDLPECRKYDSVNIAKNFNEFDKLIKNYKKKYTIEYKKILLKEAKDNSWETKALDIIFLLKK